MINRIYEWETVIRRVVSGKEQQVRLRAFATTKVAARNAFMKFIISRNWNGDSFKWQDDIREAVPEVELVA